MYISIFSIEVTNIFLSHRTLSSSKSLGSDLIYKIDMTGVGEQLYLNAALWKKGWGSWSPASHQPPP